MSFGFKARKFIESCEEYVNRTAPMLQGHQPYQSTVIWRFVSVGDEVDSGVFAFLFVTA